MFLGKIFVVISTVLLCYLMLTHWEKAESTISTPYATCFVAGVFGYGIAAIFMSVFSFASDTILQCFLVDEELGLDGRPSLNRPPILNDFIDKAKGGTRTGCCC